RAASHAPGDGARSEGHNRSCELLSRSVDEQRDELLEADGRLPAEALLRLRGVAQELITLAALQGRVDAHVLAPVEPRVCEGELDQLPHAVELSRSDDAVARL